MGLPGRLDRGFALRQLCLEGEEFVLRGMLARGGFRCGGLSRSDVSLKSSPALFELDDLIFEPADRGRQLCGAVGIGDQVLANSTPAPASLG